VNVLPRLTRDNLNLKHEVSMSLVAAGHHDSRGWVIWFVSLHNKHLFYMIIWQQKICCWHTVSSLDCYVCKNQEDNKGKCVKTVKTCDIGQDRCLTEVRWGGMPYWAPSGQKQYYVSKRCASKENCTAEKEALGRRCERIWFNDWECVDCCHGDRCNFYVTLGSNRITAGISTILASLLIYSCFVTVFKNVL